MKEHLISIPLAVLTGGFFYLKISDSVDWPWIWIFAPTWIPISLVLLLWFGHHLWTSQERQIERWMRDTEIPDEEIREQLRKKRDKEGYW